MRKIKKKKDWFKYRGYPHLSNDIPFSKKKEVKSYIENSENIRKHTFLPLISKNIIQRRFKLNDRGLRSHRVFKKGIWQSTKKVRVIEYPCHIDSHIYSYYSKNIIQPKYEELLRQNVKIDNSVIAYRKIPVEPGSDRNKCNIHFAKEVFDEIKNRKNCIALLYDVENFFPSLDHKRLKLVWSRIIGNKSLPKDHYNIFKSITNYSYVHINDIKINKRYFDEKKLAQIRSEGRHSYFISVKDFLESDVQIYKNKTVGKGIPHGLPISSLLANMYMYEFDKMVIETVVNQLGGFYRRYSDDIIVLCDPKNEDYVNNFILENIKKIELKISLEKIERIAFAETTAGIQSFHVAENGEKKFNRPLNYLGFEFYGHKTLIKSKNISAFYREMKESVATKSRRVEKLKEQLLVDELPIFKRKVYRLYSHKGRTPRTLYFESEGQKREKDYRGNFISYVYKAAEIMEAPEMKMQIRNHWKILQNTISKYNFSNARE